MVLCTLFTCWALYKSSGSGMLLFIGLLWLFLQGIVAFSGFYTVTNTLPPRFLLLVGPPLLFIILLFILPAGRKFLDGLDPKWLVALHIVRVPVEITLFLLFSYHFVPQLMTFEGRNLDILSGISAVLIFYFGYHRRSLNRAVLVTWNIICLALLFNIVIIAILSVPTPFQKLAFDQPNVGVLYFPFIWLPAFIVPAVLFSHLASLRSLFKNSPPANTTI